MNKAMNNRSIFLSTLLLANVALAALLGLSLALAPRAVVLGLFAAAVKPGSFLLLQSIGVLLFGMSLSLWALVDVRRTDIPARVSQVVAVALVFAWITLVLIPLGAASVPSRILPFVPIVLLGAVVFIFGYFSSEAARRRGARVPDPAGEAALQQERRRLARDLHDSIKQQLFSIKLSSAAAEERWESDPGAARAALADVRRSAHAAMVEMQAMLSQLRPEPLATTGLVEALREQCEALGYRSGIPVHFEIGDLPPDSHLRASTRENLFRIAQEALSNIARHARAREVHVQLGKVEQDGVPALLLQIRDDGQGFDATGQAAGMGLRNMRERLEAVNGTLDIRSAPGEGTEVRACAPLRRKKGVRSEPSILSRHRQRFVQLTNNFWLACIIVMFLEMPNPPLQRFAVPLYWLNQVLRFAPPALLLLAFREAWRFFRLHRSLAGDPSREPAWRAAALLAILLVSLPFLFLVPNPGA
ncbi:MAG TPA: sensor histidine kinase, partial [Thermoanaerobaculia bacterium]|nr:sensor histidine kinase [Thermoanaerobaculia bacterium]